MKMTSVERIYPHCFVGAFYGPADGCYDFLTTYGWTIHMKADKHYFLDSNDSQDNF